MSYDIELQDPKTGEVLLSEQKHNLKGGTYIVGGTSKLWLNVTYNYAPHFRAVLGENGIRSLYGMTGEQSIPVLKKAISCLDVGKDEDYWSPTEGNARKALIDLLELARIRPDGVWSGD